MRDPLGIIPPEIRVRHEARELAERETTDSRAVDRELKALDPRLSCVRVKPNVPREALPPECIPGYWHVKRDNPPPMVPTYMPITTPDGGYRVPDSAVVEELRRMDLQRPGALREAMRQSDNTRKRDLEKEQRRDEMVADVRAAKRVAGEGGLRERKWGRGRKLAA